ncbi:Protein CBR-SCC-1 [Caenorhabditis briggsae]|uniref:Protein CBR-SCC-1 n=2 Tax=Caenorhabditis briggsae TaxID=6238 RepID=A0AAE9DIL3_CAEBR|nr:Protein CBR-SCC-1 [Caenorhabditis briggsae]ULU04855.1 hypothetical protein L3Y34_017540 [Caenorhabditis briggsae]CAP25034.2 Protein CBR-SCC-1 [Caenorhabditis briggsae]
MFYAQFVLAKKGPLAKIWLAAHWEKKLTKAQIYETDVPQAIEEVIHPKVKMALRTVGHLLLGIVRIYSKKTRYLLADTNEAYLKMKVNFRDGFTVEADVPLNNLEIDENFPIDGHNISVPDFHEGDYNVELMLANRARLEDITLHDYVNLNDPINANIDDGFGDEGDLTQLEQLYGSIQPPSIRPTPTPESIMGMLDMGSEHMAPIPDAPMEMERARDATINLTGVTGRDDGTTLLEAEPLDFGGIKQEPLSNDPEFDYEHPVELFDSIVHDRPYQDDNFGFEPEAEEPAAARPVSPESFALEPLDLEHMEAERKKRTRKPRKLLVDVETKISDEAFRKQQEDFTDTLKPSSLAPPSRQTLKWCVTGDLPYLMNQMGTGIRNRELLAEYRKCLTTRKFDPNFTMQELSGDSSSLTPSIAAPWEDLELNENIPEFENVAAGPAPMDDFFDDVDMGGGRFEPENYPEPLNFDRTLEAPRDEMAMDVDVPRKNEEFQNKENDDEEDWSDPFGSSISSKKGRLEAYGFGASPANTTTIDDEGKWTKRANHILKKVSADIETSGKAEFSSITATAKNRKQAAEQFYSLLSLAKSQAIQVEQSEPYGEILIKSGPKFQESVSVVPPRTPLRAIQTTAME